LLRGTNVPEAGMNVSWVEVGPGSSQQDHTHDEEQAYLVVGPVTVIRVLGLNASISLDVSNSAMWHH
jgi:hypothetical protein